MHRYSINEGESTSCRPVDTLRPPVGPIYRASEKHCESIKAGRSGTKCPRWSIDKAQRLLDESIVLGDKRFATLGGLIRWAKDAFWRY